jgi:4-hydroxy 2-oxovalerate aldolase
MTLLELHTDRHIIIDSSVYGIGRGAGNLNTELLAHYINSNIEKRYNLVALLELMDDVILPIYKSYSWGFSVSYYLSAILGVHPNYATYLIDKQSIGMSKIFEILKKLPDKDKHIFNRSNIETVYHMEMSNYVEDYAAITDISMRIKDRNVLVIAPGSSSQTCINAIYNYIESFNPFILSVNHIPTDIKQNLVFISNRKRYMQLQHSDIPLAVTSNINPNGNKTMYVIDYDSLLPDKYFDDFSGIMVLRFLIRLGAKHVTLSGYDGFSDGENYYNKNLERYITADTIASLNNSMTIQLNEIAETLFFDFLTPSVYRVHGNF